MTETISEISNDLTLDTPIMAFAQLQLAAPLARAVAEMGYETMTPIQAQAIPVVLQGRDGCCPNRHWQNGRLRFAAVAAHAQA